jgi:hypothetical protein
MLIQLYIFTTKTKFRKSVLYYRNYYFLWKKSIFGLSNSYVSLVLAIKL